MHPAVYDADSTLRQTAELIRAWEAGDDLGSRRPQMLALATVLHHLLVQLQCEFGALAQCSERFGLDAEHLGGVVDRLVAINQQVLETVSDQAS